MTVALIAAQAKNQVIGKGTEIPWRVKGEQQLFRNITMGGTLIMGRKTYDSIGRPLPGRKTIVVSRNPDLKIDGCNVSASLDAALRDAKTTGDPIFIAGGGELYKQAMEIADEIHLTTIDTEVDGDVFFPSVPDSFTVIEEHQYESNINYLYQLLRRN